MGTSGQDEDGAAARPVPSDASRSARRAEALRANLKRRKAQSRARDERRPDPLARGE